MASGSLGAEEYPRAKHRWDENCKVYSRRINKNKNPKPIENNNLNKVVVVEANGDSIKNGNRVANCTDDKVIENGNERGKDVVQEKPSPSKEPPRIETVSVDSSSLSRPEAPVSNGHEASLENGSGRPMVTRVDDRLNISVSGASSKEEVRELKRKLEGELDQIRKMTKKLEVKEIQLSGYSNSGVDLEFSGHGGVTSVSAAGNLPYHVNNGVGRGVSGSLRASSEMGSLGFNSLRPSRLLSVSVMDNNHGIGEIVEKEKRTPKANQFYRNSEFLLGKEKLPGESNRRSKSAGGKRHGSREVDYGFGTDKHLFKSCSNLLQKLMGHKHGWVFREPVDVMRLGLHDYFDIIKHPMDLGTVKTRLANNWYKTPREFAEDVRLTFRNAMTYNPEGQDVHVMAKDLLRLFEDKWMSIEIEYDRKLRYEMIGVPTPTSRKSYAHTHIPSPMSLGPPPLLHNPPTFKEARHLERSRSMPVPPPESRSKPLSYVARTPVPKKPKAKDPNKRDMTFEEKQRLSTNLQGLPTDKLENIVQIIKKRNSALSQHDDEIEVDIDSVDTETLWELDRFVTNYKKNMSKRKRKAELAQARAAAAAAQAAQETIPVPTNHAPTIETRQDQGNVATPRVEPERPSDNNSGSSSSSSSSSDSGSSSSDSDSDSSSGYESNGGQ